MTLYLLKRFGLALLTLVLLSLIIFFACQVLPGDPGRAILGPFASESAVKALDKALGVDRSLISQYWSWVSGLVHGDMGTSYQFRAPVGSFLWPALGRSLKLAAVAFVIVVPLSIVGGVVAALNRGNAVDRGISVAGLSLTTVPEFVSGRSEITSPWDIVRLNLDTRTHGYVGEELSKAPNFGTGVTLESADFLLRFCPERVAHRIAPRPLLIVHGAQNELYKPIEAQSLYDHAHEPKQLRFLEHTGHTEWMFDDSPAFSTLIRWLDDFLSAALAHTPAPTASPSQGG
jgi:Binding-prot-dependent transport system membrane comp, N-term